MRDLFFALTRNAVSFAGTALTTASALVFLVLLTLDVAGRLHGPYLGILAYLFIPLAFLLGLLLIPIGIARQRRRAARASRRSGADGAYPVVDLNVGRTRSIL